MSDERIGDEESALRPERLGEPLRLRLVQLGSALRVAEGVPRDRTWQLSEEGLGAGRVFYFGAVEELREFLAAFDAAIDKLRERHEARTEGPVSLLVYLTGFESVRGEPDAESPPKPER